MQQNNTEQAVSTKQGSRKKSLTIFAIILLIVAGVSFYYYENYVVGKQDTDDAYVNGNLVQISPEITGTVTQIDADDGDYVEKGQPLVYLDSLDAKIAFENSLAILAQSVRQVRTLFNQLEEAKAVVQSRSIALHKAQSDFNRRKDMVKAGGLSREELSHARDMMESASQDLAVAKQQLQSRQAAVYNTTVATHPMVQSAISQVRKNYLNQQRTVLVAPVSGYIAKRSVQVGQRISQNSALMAVVPLDQVWVEANFKETQMSNMRIGQPVSLTSDLYGEDVVYHGEIESLGIGTGSAFSLLPAQNATGNWIKVVQRLPVRVKLHSDELRQHPLRIGLSMVVDVDIENEEGALLATQPNENPRYSTDVYSRSSGYVDALVKRIIDANDSQAGNDLDKQ